MVTDDGASAETVAVDDEGSLVRKSASGSDGSANDSAFRLGNFWNWANGLFHQNGRLDVVPIVTKLLEKCEQNAQNQRGGGWRWDLPPEFPQRQKRLGHKLGQ